MKIKKNNVGTYLPVLNTENLPITNGELVIRDLSIGSYKFVEVTGSKNYIKNEFEHTFEIVGTEDQPNLLPDIEFEFINYQGSVQLTKTGESEDDKLKDVTFDLYKGGKVEDRVVIEKGTLVEAGLTTDENGVILVETLAPGTYYFEEVSNANGHIIDTRVTTFTIVDSYNGIPPLIEISATNAYAAVEIYKVDEAGEDLSGSVFGLFHKGEEVAFQTTVSQENGLVRFDGLRAGEYVIKEIEATNGYVLNEQEIHFEVDTETDEDKVIVVFKDKFINYLGGVTLEKKGVDETPLENVVFDLYAEDGTLVEADLKTDADGVLTRLDLSPGKYYFIETSTVDGYIIYTEKIDFEVEKSTLNKPENTFLTFTNFKAGVTLNKVDVNGVSLVGAEFGLFDSETGELIDTETSDVQGLVEFKNVSVGKYIIREVKPAEGFVLNTQEIEFEVEDKTDQKEVHIELGDYINYKGDVELNKLDEFGVILEGVVFDLYTEDDVLVYEGLVSDEFGKINVVDLAVGTYYFKEVSSVDGNLVNTEKHFFTIVDSALNKPDNVVMTISNAKGLVEFNKVNENGDTLAGAKFELYLNTEEGLVLYATVESDDEGYVFADGLVAGDYVFREVTAADGYILNTKEVEFNIPEEAEVEKVVITLDDYVNYQGSVIVNKVDKDGKLLKGAKFELLDKDLEVLQVFKAKSGSVQLDNLSPGTYFIRETKAPRGYKLSDKLYEFTIDEESFDKPEAVEVDFVNTKLSDVKTGLGNNSIFFLLLFVLSALFIVVNTRYYVRKRRG